MANRGYRRHSVHLLNCNNRDMIRGWFKHTYPLDLKGPVTLPTDAHTPHVTCKLLRAGKEVPFSKDGQVVEFVIPGVTDRGGCAWLKLRDAISFCNRLEL